MENKINKAFAELWNKSDDGRYMLNVLQNKTNISLRDLTKIKAECASLALKYMEFEESRNAVEVAKRFGDGGASMIELKEAATKAYRESTDAAAYAADPLPSYTGYMTVAGVAYLITGSVHDSPEKRKVLKKCAEIIRKHVPQPKILS